MACQNPVCMYLHDLGEDADSFSKEELALGKQNLRDHISSEVDSKPQVLGQHARPPTPADFPPMMSSYQSGRRPATLESVAHIQFKNKPEKQPPTVVHPNDSGEDVSAANSEDEKCDEKSALPATVSWATGSGPNTPNLKSAPLPLTPDNFGPSLAAAAAAAASAKQQAQIRAKANKKRNKERLEVGSQSSAVDDENKSTSDGHVPQLVSDSGEEAENEMDEMEFTQYVLGGSANHLQRLLAVSDMDAEDMEDEVVGIQALRDDPQPAEDDEPVSDVIKDSEPVSLFSILKTSLSPYSSTGYVGPFNPFAKDEPASDDMATLESLRKVLPDIRSSPTMHISPVRNHPQPLPHNVPMHAPPQNNMLSMQANLVGGGNSPQAANAFLQALQQRQPPLHHHANPMMETMMRRPEAPPMRGPPPGISHPPNMPDPSHARLSPQASMHLNILNNAAVQPEMSTQQPSPVNNGPPNIMSPHRKPSEASIFQDSAIMALGNQVASPMFNDDNQAPEARRLRVFQGLRNTEPSFTQPVANNSNDIRAGLAALLNGANYPGKLSNATPNNVAPL